MDEMGRLARLYKEYKGTGVQFLGICADVYGLNGQTCSDAKDYIASTGAGYPPDSGHRGIAALCFVYAQHTYFRQLGQDDSKVRGHSERSRMDKRDRDHNGGIFIEKLQKGDLPALFAWDIIIAKRSF